MYDVSVIIPTFRRTALLEKTICSVVQQRNALRLDYEIIVVDNSPEKSAQATVDRLAKFSKIPIKYANESRQNIALARNAGIDQSDADFVAMIDDDEQASVEWLDHLVTAIRDFNADAVIGPTKPIFEAKAPLWVIHNPNFYVRNINVPTGTQLNLGSSANFILRSSTCLANNNRFLSELGRSGGSDTDFFMRLAKHMGGKIIWCEDAKVEEFIPADRLSVRYLMRRNFRTNQGFVWCSVKYSDTPIKTAAYFMFVVGLTQFLIWVVPSLVLAPFDTAYSVRAKVNLMRGAGKLFWSKKFRFNFY